jgi:hypothetical protein
MATIDGIPGSQGAVGAIGAAAGSPILVSGIRTGNVLLAVVKHAASGVAQGLDPAAFAVSDGQIQSATVSTAGFKVHVVWAT